MTEVEFTKFYSDNYKKLLNLVRRKARKEIAEDIVAEVFTLLWEHVKGGRGTPEKIFLWLYCKARDRVKDFYKHDSIASDINTELARTSAAPHEDSFVLPEQIPNAELAGVVTDERLSAQQKHFVACIMQGLTVAEIAKSLHVSRSVADKRLAKIRAILN